LIVRIEIYTVTKISKYSKQEIQVH